jgi:hypothetical protein
MARPASLVSAIAIEAIWDRGNRFPVRAVISVELPNAPEAATVAKHYPIYGANVRAARHNVHARRRERGLPGRFPAGAKLLIYNNKLAGD